MTAFKTSAINKLGNRRLPRAFSAVPRAGREFSQAHWGRLAIIATLAEHQEKRPAGEFHDVGLPVINTELCR